jgi:hypothetical protein
VIVQVSAASGVSLSQPAVLFEQRYAVGSNISIANYDVTANGQEFVMIKNTTASNLALVLNWFEELKRLAPPTSR